MNTRSIGFRLTVWYTLVLTSGFALFGALTWFALRHEFIAEIDQQLEHRGNQFTAYFEIESAEKGAGVRDELNEFCQALAPGNHIVLRGTGGFNFRCPENAIANGRLLRRQFEFRNERFDLELGAPTESAAHTLDLLRLLLLGLSPVVIAIACIGGAWLSRRALKPVQAITAAALSISIENLSERLPVPQTGDELAALTEVLNRMLSRLESAVRTLSQFAGDASHELRTPLAVIRTTAELALRRPRQPEAYRESLEQITLEAQRMSQMVEDLLLLARKDIGAQMPLSPLDLREVLGEVCAELSSLAETRNIHLEAPIGKEGAIVSGNASALRRLFLALLDNALKYSPDGGAIVITLEQNESTVSVAIQDYGPGISEADLPHIFDRFYRADGARSTEGYGLGLSFAKNLAEAQGAQIEAHSGPGGGSVFRVAFPLRSGRASGNLQLASI